MLTHNQVDLARAPIDPVHHRLRARSVTDHSSSRSWWQQLVRLQELSDTSGRMTDRHELGLEEATKCQSSPAFASVRQRSPEFAGFMSTGHKAVALQTTLKTELREHCKIPDNTHTGDSQHNGKTENRAGQERLERDFRKGRKHSKRERPQKFKTL